MGFCALMMNFILRCYKIDIIAMQYIITDAPHNIAQYSVVYKETRINSYSTLEYCLFYVT